MKVLVDTCVWSRALRRREETHLQTAEPEKVAQLREAVQDHRVAMIGPIRQEILSGIRDKAQFARVEKLLEPFRDEEMATADYIEAARMFNLCRNHGVECGPVGMLLCAVAARNRYGILTSDHGLERCISALQSEGLLK